MAGRDFEPFFQRYVKGKERLPLADYFQKAGLHLQIRSEELPTIDYVKSLLKTSLNRVTDVYVVGINGQRIGNIKELQKYARHWKSGDFVTIIYEEDGKSEANTLLSKRL